MDIKQAISRPLVFCKGLLNFLSGEAEPNRFAERLQLYSKVILAATGERVTKRVVTLYCADKLIEVFLEKTFPNYKDDDGDESARVHAFAGEIHGKFGPAYNSWLDFRIAYDNECRAVFVEELQKHDCVVHLKEDDHIECAYGFTGQPEEAGLTGTPTITVVPFTTPESYSFNNYGFHLVGTSLALRTVIEAYAARGYFPYEITGFAQPKPLFTTPESKHV